MFVCLIVVHVFLYVVVFVVVALCVDSTFVSFLCVLFPMGCVLSHGLACVIFCMCY